MVSKTFVIKQALIQSELARNNDRVLYIIVLEALHSGITQKPFDEVMFLVDELNLPSYDTVTRIRRHLQSIYPELQACEKVQDYRSAREEKCRKEFRR